MSEKPRKRLVGKRQYAFLMTERTILVSASGLCAILGLTAFGISGMIGYASYVDTEIEHKWAIIFACVAVGLSVAAYRCFTIERRIERVILITPRNAHLLSAQESLVRASNAPPSHQQAELLRVAQSGQETRAEELLRATSGQDP